MGLNTTPSCDPWRLSVTVFLFARVPVQNAEPAARDEPATVAGGVVLKDVWFDVGLRFPSTLVSLFRRLGPGPRLS